MRHARCRRVLPGVAMLASLAFTAGAAATLYDIQKDIDLYGNLNQFSIPGVGACYCGPTAAVNSFVYLQNAYNNVYDNFLVPPHNQDYDQDGDIDFYDDMIGTALDLGSPNYMNTLCPGGTFHDDFIWGKQQYIEDQVADVTEYQAQDPYEWVNHDPPDWVDPRPPTWEFLYDELVDCEDVELLLNWTDGGHYLTLTSFHWDDVNEDGFIDYFEDAWIDYIDPGTGQWGQSDIWQAGDFIETDYNPYEPSWISMAVSESPIPGPSALALLALGTLVGRRRSRP